MGGLNKNARTAFEEPIGRTRGEQDLPWDTYSVALGGRKVALDILICVEGAFVLQE